MREDIVEQKEIEEVATKRGENEKQSDVESVNEPEESVTEEKASEEIPQQKPKTETSAQEEIKVKETPNLSKPVKKKKKKRRNRKQERILEIVRIVCVLGIVAFFFIPKKEKPAISDEIAEETEMEDTVAEIQIPTVKRAEKEINKRCESYRPQVEQMAARYGIPHYTDLLMALMMQESAGKGLDIMQSSEGAFNTRYPRVPNGITDVTYSIECGVQELKEALVKAGAKGPDDIPRIEQALQAYNFGIRYLDFSEEKGVTEWSEEIAAEYAKIASNGRTRDEYDTKLMGKWDYGDQLYPEHVLRYYAVPVKQK